MADPTPTEALQALLDRRTPPPDRTLSYGEHPDHLADVWLPEGEPPHPLVIVIHGGFWRAAFDRGHARPQCVALRDAGYAVCAIEFRRVGQDGGGWPGTFEDVAAALGSVPGQLADLIAACRVVLVGHSAGGQLALWAASRSRGVDTVAMPPARPTQIAGVVSLAGVCDLAWGSVQRLGSGAVDELLGGGPDRVPERYAAADPMRLLPLGLPTVLVHGDADDRVPIEASRRYAAAATEAGDDVTLREIHGADHFAVIDPQSGAWPEVVRAVRQILDAG